MTDGTGERTWGKGRGLGIKLRRAAEGKKPGADRRGQRSTGRTREGQGKKLLTRFCTVSSGAVGSRIRRRRQSAGAGGGEDWPLRAGTPAMTDGSFSTASFRA